MPHNTLHVCCKRPCHIVGTPCATSFAFCPVKRFLLPCPLFSCLLGFALTCIFTFFCLSLHGWRDIYHVVTPHQNFSGKIIHRSVAI